MPFNINKFTSQLGKQSYLTNNKFEFYVSPPNILRGNYIVNTGNDATISDIVDMLKFRIDETTTPVSSIITADIQRYGIGPTQKYPFMNQFNEINISVLADGWGNIWQFWHDWLNNIFNFSGIEPGPGSGNAQRFPSYTAQYKINYATMAQLIIYDIFGNIAQRINFYDLFPITMKEVVLDWNSENELLRLDLTLTYKEYTLSGTDLSDGQISQLIRNRGTIRDDNLPEITAGPARTTNR